MSNTDQDVALRGVPAALKLWRATRGALALVGLAVILALLLAPREAMLRQLTALPAMWDAAPVNVAEGTIQPVANEDARAREQRAAAEFIAKRYRVAHDAVTQFVAAAYRAGARHKVDPLLVLAVMAIESRYNPVAESNMGAKGLMQVIARFHLEKLMDHGGEAALLDPEVNILVGTQILRDYMRMFGETESALQMYAGAFDQPDSQYAVKVLAERARLQQHVQRALREA
jgi:soluble lytic murein transglycosylase-like protein